MKKTPVAVLVSDIHLSLKRPACRADHNWMGTQAYYLTKLTRIAEGLPILCAGDLFDRWNPAPELIEFAFRHLPDKMICVPGQHDLPNHRIEDVRKSAYGVLKTAGKIKCIDSEVFTIRTGHVNLQIVGYGWGRELKSPSKVNLEDIRIALVHKYIWTMETGYPGAPKDNHFGKLAEQLSAFDVAAFGDNHKGFLKKFKNTEILNCGTFIRRKRDEIDYTPSVGILFSDRTIELKKLNTSVDEFHTAEKQWEEQAFNMRAFLDSLEGLGEHGLDFCEAVKQHVESDSIPKDVKIKVLEILERSNAQKS